MLDIKLIREKNDFVRQRLATRGVGDENKIDELLQLDEQRRKSLAEAEALKSQRNRVSKEIGVMMGQKKLAEAEAKKAETKDLGDMISTLDKVAAAAGARSKTSWAAQSANTGRRRKSAACRTLCTRRR